MKCCSRCSVEKPEADFNWRSKAKGWLRPECRICQRGDYLAKKATDPVAHNAKANERKRAWRALNPNEGKQYYAKNRDRECARHAKKLAEHGEQVRAQRRALYHRDPSIQRKATQAWSARNKEHLQAYFKKHYEANKPEYFERSRRRRALKLGRRVERFSVEQLDARMSVFGHCCAYCAGPFEEVDHVIPLARGGLHILANLRPACRSCNRRKSAKPISAWLREVA